MPDYLLELFSEEIPARMQAQAGLDLEKLCRERLAAAELSFDALETFSGPRRLTLHVRGLPLRQADRTEERRGPKLGAPTVALEGFLRSTGVRASDLVERDGAYWAVISRPGLATRSVLGAVVEEISTVFPWPKSMRSAASSFRWVRPLRRILSVFDREVAPLRIDGLEAGLLTEGHRVMGAPGPFEARDFSAYREGLEDRFVVLERARRREMIQEGARNLCTNAGLELVEDLGLLEEVTGLAEWPTPILGAMDPAFLVLPPEVVRTSMRTHQKYFAVRNLGTGALAPHFIVVANIRAKDAGAHIAAGNAKVLSARLSDAAFFWREDQKIPLEHRLSRLEGVVFHAGLGSMRRRAARLEAAAAALAPWFDVPIGQAVLAARLCKCDLVTGMVGEFPELQGVMGGYYARAEGRRALGDGTSCLWETVGGGEGVEAVADAIRDHYKPQGPADALPQGRLGLVLALADKLDLLIGFFSIGERPTGSRDPFALRRAALGAVRILLEARAGGDLDAFLGAVAKVDADEGSSGARLGAILEVRAFILERFKVLLRDEGGRHDVLNAVFASGVADLAGVEARSKALGAFIASEAGASLLAGYRRASNILKAEARKPAPAPIDPGSSDGTSLSPPPQEVALQRALATVSAHLEAALARGAHDDALSVLAGLREPVDAFFEMVLVNDADPEIRRRRLGLLTAVRDTANRVADLSLLAG